MPMMMMRCGKLVSAAGGQDSTHERISYPSANGRHVADPDATTYAIQKKMFTAKQPSP